jgi:ATP-binding cassette subfamily B protein/subfamily B ATP-binding cassette protein MsbA
MKQLRRVLQFFRPDRSRILAALGLLALTTGTALLKPWPLALLVDGVFGRKPLPSPWSSWLGDRSPASAAALLTFALLAIHVAHALLTAVQSSLVIGTGLRGLTRVRSAVFACLMRMSLRRLHGSEAGDIIYRATWDTYAFQTLFQQGVFSFLTALVSVVAMTAVMWSLNLRLTLVALAVVPVLLLTMQTFGRGMNRRSHAAQAADSRVASLVQQGVANLQLTQGYTQEPREAAGFDRQAAAALDARRKQHGWEVIYLGVVATAFALGTAALVWAGIGQVSDGELTVGQLLVFLAYLAQLHEPLSQLSHVGSTVANARAGAQRVLDLLDADDRIKDGSQPVPDSGVAGGGPGSGGTKGRALGLAFKSVSFRYDDSDRQVLTDVSFAVAPGESVALIGPSGAGKTTLLNLVPRFHDPESGAVLAGGVDVREFRLREWRSCVALVLQEPLLLPATIAENIAYGRPEASRAEIEAAACAANCDGFIRQLPRGYDSVVGDGAFRLSVGEKQRLNLARAFLKDAPVLLLDEPTSSLDAESERLVTAGLADLRRGRTTLVVAHRLETIRGVDKVAVLVEGRLVEFGSPDELRRLNGYFARATQVS